MCNENETECLERNSHPHPIISIDQELLEKV
jgi:hypothetical protein